MSHSCRKIVSTYIPIAFRLYKMTQMSNDDEKWRQVTLNDAVNKITLMSNGKTTLSDAKQRLVMLNNAFWRKMTLSDTKWL